MWRRAATLVVIAGLVASASLVGCSDGSPFDVPLSAVPNSITNPNTPRASNTGRPGPGGGGQITRTCGFTQCTGQQVTSSGQTTDGCGTNPARLICCDGTISCATQNQGACSGHGGICAEI